MLRPTALLDAAMPRRWGRNFRPLLGSSWASNLGDGILLVAAPLLVESLTDDPLLVGVSWLLGRLPWLLFALPAGVLADRLDRRRLLVVSDLSRVIVIGALAIGITTGVVNVALALVAVFVIGVGEVFADTTSSTLLPMIVDHDDLGPANTRFVFGSMILNHLIGPSIGAALFVAGSAVPFAAGAVTMAAGAVLIARLRLTAVVIDDDAPTGLRSQIVEGVRWLRDHPPLRTLAITIVVFNVTFGAAFSVLVVLATDRLGLDEVGFGLLTAMSAIGGILGALTYSRLEARIGMAWIMRAGLIIETILHLVLATATTAWPAFIAMFAFGVHGSMWATTSTTVRQRVVPEHLQGRVGSVYLFGLQGGLVIGAALGAVLAGRVDITAPYWFGFVGSALMLAAIWKTLGLLAAQRPEPTAVEPVTA